MIRRQIPAENSNQVSLFPFLAVLVCTMGALIVLLVLVVQQARVHATTIQEETTAEAEEQEEQLRIERENHQWRSEILKQQREELVGKLSSKRLELSHLEDHIRRLEQEFKTLLQQSLAVKNNSELSDEERAKLEAEAEKLRVEIDRMREEVANAKEAAAKRKPAYAIVPFKGRNGTFRKPIYIECLADRVVIHPGGIALAADDFSGPSGPGNPLDATLRAIREYWNRHGVTGNGTEPYPLLIVRPGGTGAYSAARQALKSWDDEFGYELVGEDMEIAFPPPDITLNRELVRVIELARQRQKILAMAMPSRNGSGFGGGGLVATPGGGFVPADRGNSGNPGTGFSDRRAADGNEFGTSGDPANPFGSASPQPQPAGGRANKNAVNGQTAGDGTASVSPLATTRGKNWAVPKTGNQNAPTVTRPIRIICDAQQLTILPDINSSNASVVIPWDENPVVTMDRFTNSIRQHIERWGIAFSGGNWNPVLKVEVVDGAMPRFRDLKVMLEGSGLGVERKY